MTANKKLAGTVFKRCSCTRTAHLQDGTSETKPWGKACPQLTYKDGRWAKDHGTWRFQLEVPTSDGGKREHLRAGFPTETECRDTLAQLVALLRLADLAEDPNHAMRVIAARIRAALKAKTPLPSEDELRGRLTLGQPVETELTLGRYLTEWLETKADLAGGTLMGYEMHIRVHLIPHLGHIPLSQLRVSHIRGMVTAIEAQNAERRAAALRKSVLKAELAQAVETGDRERAKTARMKLKALGRPEVETGPTTVKRIRATLSSALSDAVAQMLIPVNPAKLLRLSGGRRPRGLVWTPPRVVAWRKTGEKPSPVMIWTVEQTIDFLKATHGHRFATAYHLMVFTGMRRGETAGLHWRDVDLDAGELMVTCQIAQIGWRTELTQPKTEDSYRTIALSDPVIELLRAHQEAQDKQRIECGDSWTDTGLVFTHEDGTALHPAQLTYEFYKLVATHELPPIRLHDVRHGTATHALTAGIDVKLVQDLLGHSTSSFTRDTYQGVADEARRAAAARLAKLLGLAADDGTSDGSTTSETLS
ncbi:tyrosine-type recombinase/integrase [Actinospica sp. MGRD01-02]|uniref:Tyrosine-type recombinase/integrase n=1 Tax=Actinospica acidithermotolerans TaxID=2828514 RepID=A0A941IF62_9ACTN|nr:tyrosine-type recombinase/integrase [Actinospica acidithermotolerans]MBR7824684.1 tyrosine-type recombinase/integrase [Actinospica acidithermotolerans]